MERIDGRFRKRLTRLLGLAVFGASLGFQTAFASEQKLLLLEQNASKRPLTEIVVNGERASGLIDTGATIALFDEKIFADDEAVLFDQEETRVLGIGGQRSYPIAELPRLSAGADTWTDVRVAVNTGNRFPVRHAILPLSLFEESIVDFDFRNDRVLLYDGRPKMVRRGRTSKINYVDSDGLIFVDIRINGAKGRALIDTGADISFVNLAFANASKAKIDEVETHRIRGSDQSLQTASIYTFRNMRFAGSRISKFAVPVLETDLFAELGFVDEPMMLLGMDFLQHYRMQIDRERKRISFVTYNFGDGRG
ncbi:MAG: aspartyl protease family protein [Pseudomonadota bacterium]